MPRQKVILKPISIFIILIFSWTNCVWAGGFSYQFQADKLAPQIQVANFARMANEIQLGGIVLRTIANHAVGNNLDLHRDWEGRSGLSDDIKTRLAGKEEGFKVCFSGSSVYVVRGAFIHRYSIDNQTEDPLYISCLKQYEDNIQMKILDDDVILDGQSRRLKVFVIAPEIRSYLSSLSQYMVGELAEIEVSVVPQAKVEPRVSERLARQVPIQYQNLVLVVNSQHGAGKSSLTHYVARKTGLPIFSAGAIKRRMAGDRGMTIEEFNTYLEKHPDERKTVNDLIDQAQLEAIRKGGVIIDSSFGSYLVENARGELQGKGMRIFKIFVKADLDVRAQRVVDGKREGDQIGSVDEIMGNLSGRDGYDRRQFLQLSDGAYDIFDEHNYDIVFDNTRTTLTDIERFADRVIDGLQYPGRVRRSYGSLKSVDIDLTFNIRTGEFVYQSRERLTNEEEENLKRSLRNWLLTTPLEVLEIKVLVTENIDAIAQHRPSIIELHRALLRAPPGITETKKKEYRLFADGVVWHEGYHFLNPTLNEEQARQGTLKYFRARRDILMATLNILRPDKDNSFFVIDDWFTVLGDLESDLSRSVIPTADESIESAVARLRKIHASRGLTGATSFIWTRGYISTVLRKYSQGSIIVKAINEVLNLAVLDRDKGLDEIDLIYKKYESYVSVMDKINFFKEFYFGIHPNFEANFSILSKVYGSEDRAIKEILRESEITGYSVITTVCGTLDNSYDIFSLEPIIAEYTKRGPPELRPRYVYVGGGGQGATILARSFVSRVRELSYRLKRKLNPEEPIVVNIFAISDDGGSSGIMQVEMRQDNSGVWRVYFFSPGDAASIVGRQTDNDLKEDIYIYESLGRLDARININEATKEQLLAVFTDEETKGISARRDELDKLGKKFADIKEINSIIGEERFKKVEKQIFLGGKTTATVEELLIGQLTAYRDKVDKGEVLKKLEKSVKKLPDDWNLFMANNIVLARIIDKEFIKTGMIKLSEASWKNLVMIAYLVQSKMIQKGYTDTLGIWHSAVMTNLDELEDLLQATGAFGSMMLPSTQDEAYQAAVLEAGLLEINGDSYVYRLRENDMAFTPASKVRDEFADIDSATRTLGEKINDPANNDKGIVEMREDVPQFDLTMYNSMLGQEFTTRLNGASITPAQIQTVGKQRYVYGGVQTPGAVQFKYEKGNNTADKVNVIEVFIDGVHSFALSEVKGEEGKTQIEPVEDVDLFLIDEMEYDEETKSQKIKTQKKLTGTYVLPTDASKVYIKCGNNIIGLRSRLVEGQTFMTDEMQHSAVEEFLYKEAIMKNDPKGPMFDSIGKDKRGNVVKQFRTITDQAKKPKAIARTIQAIQNARDAIISGESSLYTSVLAGLAINGIPQAIRAKKDIPRIFIWKISTDLETAGLTLQEQIETIERAVKDATGEDIKFEDMFSHIVIADIPDDSGIKKEFQDDRAKKFVKLGSPAVAASITLGKEKLSKFLPSPMHKITPEDEKYLIDKGVIIIRTSYVKPHEGKVIYDKEKLTKFLDSLAEEWKVLGDSERKGQEVFYPMVKLHQQFNDMVNKSANPGHVTFFIDRGENGTDRFDLKIPSIDNLRNDPLSMDFMAWYVAMYIYNCLHVLGGRGIIIDAQEDIFDAIVEEFNSRFNPEKGLKVDEFIEKAYGSRLEIVKGKVDKIIAKKGGESVIYDVTPDNGKISLGVSISGSFIKVVVLKGDQIIGEPQLFEWSPAEYTNKNDFIDQIAGKVSDMVVATRSGVGAENISAFGIAWKGVVLNGEIKTTRSIVPEIPPGDLKDFSRQLANKLGIKETVPVAVINDGNAMGISAQRGFIKRNGKPLRKALCLNLLAGVAGSYIDANGAVVEDILGEFGNIILDLPYEAEPHTVTGVPGVLQRYLSRNTAIELAKKFGLALNGTTEIEKEADLRGKAAGGNERAILIYKTLGKYLAATIAELYNLVDIENVVLSGTVFYGNGGAIVIGEAKRYLSLYMSGIKGVDIILLEAANVENTRTRIESARGAALAAPYAGFWRACGEIKRNWLYEEDFKPSYMINELFGKIKKFTDFTDEVKIAFDRGSLGARVFTLRIPKQEYLAIDKDLKQIIEEALVKYVYNRLGAIGATKVYVDNVYACNILKDWFEFDPIQVTFADIRKSTDKRKPYWIMTDYLNMVYETGGVGKLVEQKATADINSLQPEIVLPVSTIDKTQGEVIGLDIGGSDIKVVVFKNGAITYYEEMKAGWTPKDFKNVNQHLDKIFTLLERAKQKGGLGKIDAIGVSINLALNGERITGKGPVLGQLKGADVARFQNLANEISAKYTGTVVGVINDGDAGALWAGIDMDMKNVLFLSFGTGLAVGYVDEKGNVTGILGEMGNVSIDMGARAAKHDFTGMPGAGQVYLSQRPIIDAGRLAEQRGIRPIGTTEAEKLENIQKILTYEKASEADKEKIREIFRELGKYLAVFLAEAYNYVPMANVVIAGRVTKGKGGEILKASAEAELAKILPAGISITIKFPEAPSGVALPTHPEDSAKSIGEIYKGISQAIGAVYFGMQKAQNPANFQQTPAQPSQISRKIERQESKLYTATLDKTGKITGQTEEVMAPEVADKYRQYFSQETLQKILDRLKEKYEGLGIFGPVERIEVVDNLDGLRLEQDAEGPMGAYRDGVVRIDIDAFRSEALLYDVLEHEFLHNILGLLNINKGTDEVTATYRSAKSFLSGDQAYRNGIIGVLESKGNGLDSKGDYLKLLQSLLDLETAGQLTDAKVISSVVRYLLTTERYIAMREELGIMDEALWEGAVKQTETRMDAVLEVYDDLIKAKYGIEDARYRQVSRSITSDVIQAGELVVKVVKTFKGIKVSGLDKLTRRLAMIISSSVNTASKMRALVSVFDIAVQKQAKETQKFCFVLDKERIPAKLADDWAKEIENIKKQKTADGQQLFNVVYSIGEATKQGYTGRQIIHLKDPVDLQGKMTEGILYLPMPYLRSSLYMAAIIVIAGGDVDKIDQLVKGLIGDLYGQILSREIRAADLENLFKAPWLILPEIRRVTGDINNLRKMLVEIEKAA